MAGRPVAVSLAQMGQSHPVTPDRALWDQLSEQQAALWRAGKVDTPEYNAVIDQIQALVPPEGIAGFFAGGRMFGLENVGYHAAEGPAGREYRLNKGATPIPRRVVNGRAYGDFDGASLARMGRR